MLRIFKIVRSVRLSKTSSRVSRSSLDFILTRRSRSYLSSRLLSFSSTLSDNEFTQLGQSSPIEDFLHGLQIFADPEPDPAFTVVPGTRADEDAPRVCHSIRSHR